MRRCPYQREYILRLYMVSAYILWIAFLMISRAVSQLTKAASAALHITHDAVGTAILTIFSSIVLLAVLPAPALYIMQRYLERRFRISIAEHGNSAHLPWYAPGSKLGHITLLLYFIYIFAVSAFDVIPNTVSILRGNVSISQSMLEIVSVFVYIYLPAIAIVAAHLYGAFIKNTDCGDHAPRRKNI